MNPVSIEKQEELWDRILDFDGGKFVTLNAENNSSLALVGRNLKYPSLNRPIDIEGIYCESSRDYKRLFCITMTEDAKTYENIQHLVSICSNILTKEKIKEWVITDGEVFWFIPTNQYQDIEALSFEASINRLSRIFTNQVSFAPQNLWSQIISVLYQNWDEENIPFISKLASLDIQDRDFESDNYSIYLNEEKEKLIFETLLSQTFDIEHKGELCRYISQGALERLLIDNIISMSGLAGMNDTSELHALNIIPQIHHTQRILREEFIPTKIKLDNDFFINSFCDKNKSDDLTMWRLYGEDGKGACLTFEYDIQKLNKDAFTLLPVTYLNPYKTPQCVIIKFLHGNLTFYNRTLILRNLATWEHFIKPHEFSDEREVRLLYNVSILGKPTPKWIRNQSNGIFHPVINFEKKLYPLRLKSITLGPKFAEIDTNIRQVYYLAKRVDSNVIIKKSQCKYYR